MELEDCRSLKLRVFIALVRDAKKKKSLFILHCGIPNSRNIFSFICTRFNLFLNKIRFSILYFATQF